jgi:hypothetical protein
MGISNYADDALLHDWAAVAAEANVDNKLLSVVTKTDAAGETKGRSRAELLGISGKEREHDMECEINRRTLELELPLGVDSEAESIRAQV